MIPIDVIMVACLIFNTTLAAIMAFGGTQPEEERCIYYPTSS